MTEGAQERMVEGIFPRSTMITPNLVEASALLGRTLRTEADVEAGAAELLRSSGAKGVLIKGGHLEDAQGCGADGDGKGGADEASRGSAGQFSQDYWTDGSPGGSFWLTVSRLDTDNTHGTGCTLSSASATCLAQGFDPADAVIIAKAYVTQGIREAKRIGKGPGPVAQTRLPTGPDCFPWVTRTALAGARDRPEAFPPCHRHWGVYPIVDSASW